MRKNGLTLKMVGQRKWLASGNDLIRALLSLEPQPEKSTSFTGVVDFVTVQSNVQRKGPLCTHWRECA